jgi:hypothetical protein
VIRFVPRVNEAIWSSGAPVSLSLSRVTPIDWAIVAGRQRPVFVSSVRK